MKLLCLVYCWFTIIIVKAQEPLSGMYKAKNGHIVVSAKQDSAVITAQSDQLLIVLKCENAEMTARLNINTLNTGIERFDSLLSASNQTAFFIGNMDVDFINTKQAPPMELNIAGMLTLNSISRPMLIKAKLDVISDDESAGVLSGNLAISLNDFNLRRTIPFISDLLIIQFSQRLLKSVCE